LPVGRNPYLDEAFYTDVLAAGALYPARGAYSVVFDSATEKGAGSFAFRFWVNDVTPPTLRFPTRTVSRGSNMTVGATDSGSGVSPEHVFAWVDDERMGAAFRNGFVRVRTAGLLPGRHRLRLQVSDYQETKNTENVARILPNTTILSTTITIR
jgi:catechol 2,3-dioxygenase-like lactoylglutathione lyase family enzyme